MPSDTSPADDLVLTLVQTPLDWENAAANRARFDTLLHDITDTHLVILPEMFTTGFSMASERLAEPPDGPTLAWLSRHAARLNAVVTGSIITRDGDHHYNRLVWMRPDGSHASYDKRHLFRMAEEHRHYTPGAQRLIVRLRGWRICPQICYDLRFPVFTRNRPLHGTDNHQPHQQHQQIPAYDLLLYTANWPAARARHWRTLLRARAIENLAWVAAVNRIGRDGNNIDYQGDSALIDPLGETVFEAAHDPCIQTLTLSAARLARHRTDFPAHQDMDTFRLDS